MPGQLSRLACVVAARSGHVLAERTLCALCSAPYVFAPENPVVLSAGHPTLQLGGPDRVHRMRQREGAQQLIDDVEPLTGAGVLVGLLHERFHIELTGEMGSASSAGHLH